MKSLTIISFLLFVGGYGFGQINDFSIRKQVLNANIIDSMFVFGKWTEDGNGQETHLKYLGQFATIDGRIFKIMTSSWYWGLSKRATSRILIFNEKNQYVGNYYMTMVADLPYKLEGSLLKFNRIECSDKLVSEVDFKKGLKKLFYVGCAGKNGDVYSFN